MFLVGASVDTLVGVVEARLISDWRCDWHAVFLCQGFHCSLFDPSLLFGDWPFIDYLAHPYIFSSKWIVIV